MIVHGEARVLVPRRSFLAALGVAAGGLALGSFASAQPKPPAPKGLAPSAFVHVAADGTVTIVCARSEMGQGVRSSLPALIADEMGADMARVKIVQADGDAVYGDQNTDGSHSVRGHYKELRQVGATARAMLVLAAANRWRVKPATCEAKDHVVVHAPTKRELGFGALADDAARLPVPKPEAAPLKRKDQLKHVGKELPLVDGFAIVTGRAIFGADVVLPGMLTAVIARPPVPGGKVARFDASRALAIAGVKRALELPAIKKPFAFQPLGGVAVVATSTWAALKGRAALDLTWDLGDNVVYDSDAYKETLAKTVSAPCKSVREVGDVDAALAKAARRVEAVYHTPHLAHASMEPPVAVAHVTKDHAEVWAPTQDPQTARKEVAKAIGLDESKVTLHVTFLGGGFGRKSKPDFIVEAALVSKAVGAPVRVQWTREDDVRHDFYHSTSAQRFDAGIDAANKVVAWRHRTAFPPIGSTFSDTSISGPGELQQGVLDVPLAVPNVRCENGEAKAHARIGWLRSVANVYHAFAVQSFFDEVAHARGKDPKESALELLGPPRVVTPAELGVAKVPNYGAPLDEHPIDTARHRRVLLRACELARWDTRRQDGRALGLAVHRSFLTYVAVVASAVKRADGGVAIDEAWIVADAGTIVNLERVRSQLEGAVIFGLGIALYGEITMKKGVTEQGNFRAYKIARIADAPRAVHVEVIESDAPSGGVGEPGVPPVAPAIANAVFALTGKRVRDLPIARAFA